MFTDNITFKTRLWNSIKYPSLFIATLWIIQVVNYALDQSLNVFGIFPREFHGLIGLFTSNFLHGNWNHLMGNTPILWLLASLLCFYNPKHLLATSIIGSLIGGAMTWLFGLPGYHVGASLLIFVLWGAFIGYAIFQRKAFFIIACLILMPAYGYSMLYGLIPTQGVSFIGHFGGLIGGLIVSYYYEKDSIKKITPSRKTKHLGF